MDQLCPITRDNEDRRKDHIETSNRNNNAVGKNPLTNESKIKPKEPCTAPILLNTFDNIIYSKILMFFDAAESIAAPLA